MTFLALAVSVEELARELPAARRGRPEVSFGNVAGSILAFFLCNAGLIALIRPIAVDPLVIRFYLPVCLVTVGFAMACLAALRVPRWAGGVLVGAYLVFFVGAHVQ
jgi:cation:H+ antiporter